MNPETCNPFSDVSLQQQQNQIKLTALPFLHMEKILAKEES